MLTTFADSIHYEIVTSTHFVYYNFMGHKEELIMILVSLGKSFYKGFEKEWSKFVSVVENNRMSRDVVTNYFATKEISILNFLSFILPKIKNP